MRLPSTRHVALALVIVACRAERGPEPIETSGDLAVLGAVVVDGTGAPARTADVLVRDGRILRVGELDREEIGDARRIDGRGRVLAPGFIDLHAHGDPLDETFENALAQGVTTIVLGQDGRSAGASWARRKDFADGGVGGWIDELERRGTTVNVAAMAGHGTLRQQAGVGPRPAPIGAERQAALEAALARDLAAGAFGMTTGLEYVPGRYADRAELVGLARVVGSADGVVMSHMRTEDDDGIDAALAELAAQGAHCRVHVSHLKVVLGRGAARGDEVLGAIDGFRAAGVEMTADVYPYTAGYTGIAILFPEWALPPNDYSAAVEGRRDELVEHLRARVERRNGPGALLFGSGPFAGRTLADAARAEAGADFTDVLVELGPGGASGAHFTQDDATHDVFVTSPRTAIASDGGPSLPHPRSTGTFALLFERYVAARGALSLEEAVRKATGLPASVLRRDDIGVIRVGAHADLVLFDPAQVRARSSYLDPEPLAEGFDVVVVSGRVAWEAGKRSEERHGRVLRRGARTVPLVLTSR